MGKSILCQHCTNELYSHFTLENEFLKFCLVKKLYCVCFILLHKACISGATLFELNALGGRPGYDDLHREVGRKFLFKIQLICALYLLILTFSVSLYRYSGDA